MNQNVLKKTGQRIRVTLALLLVFACLACAGMGFAEALDEEPDLFYSEHSTGDRSWFDEPDEVPVYEDKLTALHQYHQEVARQCLERAGELPEGSKTRACYELYAGILSQPLPGKPTEAESKAYCKEKLSKISSQLKPYAVDYYETCVRAEPKITTDLCTIARVLDTEMFGIKYRIKSAADNENGVCRIADKIAEYIKEGEMTGNPITYEEATNSLKDILRYSQAGTPETLANNYFTTKDMLEAQGYMLLRCRNTWQTFTKEAPYRGINTIFISPDGIMFELQFHTAESLVTKEVCHSDYEIARDPRTSEEERQALYENSYKLYAAMTEPEHIELIY